jgi:6-phosphogluconolactonase (cycloisomerase 2 family)
MVNQAAVLICRVLAVNLGMSTPRAYIPYRCIPRLTFAAIVLVAVTACGGGGSTPPPSPPAMYSIGGTVSGLDAGESVTLQLNGGNDQTVSTNVAFTFASKIASGGAYAVSVAGGPAGKTCTVNAGAGTASANVTGVVVACVVTPTYSIGGAVSGLVGQGLELALEKLVISYKVGCVPRETLGIDKNGEFVFATHWPSDEYCVGIQQQPHSPTQRCVVRNGNRFVAANVTDVEVVCSDFSYVANAADSTISALSIDATSGAIASAGPPVSAGVSPVAIAGTSDKKYVYVVNSGSNDVSAFTVDSGTGALATVPGSPIVTGTNPRALAFFETTYLYVANAGSDTVSAYQIDQNTGLPKPLSPISYATGAGPVAMAIDPYPGFLYVANTGSSSNISAFRIYDATGSLTPIAGSPFPSGSSVSSLALAFGAGGAFLYAADANGGAAAIYGFSIDGTTGALISRGGFPYPLPSCKFIVADQTGAYLYATTGTDILGYSIDATTGALTALPGFPITVGADVRSVSIDPTNQFLYVANGSAGTVTSYTLNATTGALTLMPGSPFAVGTSADYITTF